MAISNYRIVHVGGDTVSFSYKDYRDGGRKGLMELSHGEFVRRFAQHILPRRFVRIRHYGILSSSWKRGRLQGLQKELGVERREGPVATLLRRCPCCGTGTLVTIEVFGQRGPPERYLRAAPSAPVA